MVSEDEEYKCVKFEKILVLCFVFIKNGMVIVVNVLIINDGVVVIILVSKCKVEELGFKLLVKIVVFVDVVQEFQWFIMVLILVVFKVLKWVGMMMSDVDYFEVNEVFFVVSLVFVQEMEIDCE